MTQFLLNFYFAKPYRDVDNRLNADYPCKMRPDPISYKPDLDPDNLYKPKLYSGHHYKIRPRCRLSPHNLIWMRVHRSSLRI